MMNHSGRNRAAFLAALAHGVLVLAGPLHGAINIELRPRATTAVVGELIDVDLFAVSDDPNSDQSLFGLQAVLQWNAQYLRLVGHEVPASGGWILSGFFDDSKIDGLNNSHDDGDAYFQAAVAFPGPLWATPSGLLVTTLSFRALAPTPNTLLSIPSEFGQFTVSEVFGEVPGQVVTGTLGTTGFPVTSHPVWGHLFVQEEPGATCIRAGELITVLIDVADLLEPINGVQALLQYDTDALVFMDVLTGDGVGSPWNEAVTVDSAIDGGVAILMVLLGNASMQDATVARVQFLTATDITSQSATMQIIPQFEQLATALTLASTGETIIPTIVGLAVFPPVGDTDGDGDIDLADFGTLVGCFGGPDLPAIGDCGCLDFEQDGDIDLLDFAELQNRLTGSL